jgi:hypothetical protein
VQPRRHNHSSSDTPPAPGIASAPSLRSLCVLADCCILASPRRHHAITGNARLKVNPSDPSVSPWAIFIRFMASLSRLNRLHMREMRRHGQRLGYWSSFPSVPEATRRPSSSFFTSAAQRCVVGPVPSGGVASQSSVPKSAAALAPLRPHALHGSSHRSLAIIDIVRPPPFLSRYRAFALSGWG